MYRHSKRSLQRACRVLPCRVLPCRVLHRTTQRSVYNGTQVIYPSSHWFNRYQCNVSRYRELINPRMSDEPLTADQVEKVKHMLDQQTDILGRHGPVTNLHPLAQTVEQYLFGVNDITNTTNVKDVLTHLGSLGEDGTLQHYQPRSIIPKVQHPHELRHCTKLIGAIDSALNGVASNAMDTIYFANLWLYLGRSRALGNRPVVVLQSAKYHSRQIERYYGIIACMALGVTPLQIGGDSQGRPLFFEGMADVLPVEDKHWNPLLLVARSSRSHVEGYGNLQKMAQSLDLDRTMPDELFIVDIQEQQKEVFFHLDLAMHVDATGKLYLGENVLQPHNEASLIARIGEERVVIVPEVETQLYGLNAILYDHRFGASRCVAITREDCPVLVEELKKSGYEVFRCEEMFTNGGGSARCRLASLDVGPRPHTFESFVKEQMFIEQRLGPSYAVVTSKQVETFRKIFDASHLDGILGEAFYEKHSE